MSQGGGEARTSMVSMKLRDTRVFVAVVVQNTE